MLSLYHLNLLSMLALLHHFPVPLDISSIAFCISPYVNVVGTPNLGSFTLQTLSHTPAAGDFCRSDIFLLLRTGLVRLYSRSCKSI